MQTIHTAAVYVPQMARRSLRLAMWPEHQPTQQPFGIRYLLIPAGVGKGCFQVLHSHLEDVRLRLVLLMQSLHLPTLVDSVLLVLRLNIVHAVSGGAVCDVRSADPAKARVSRQQQGLACAVSYYTSSSQSQPSNWLPSLPLLGDPRRRHLRTHHPQARKLLW